MTDKTAKYVYQGNPGYSYPFISDAVLNPGDEVELTEAQAAQVGEDFAPKTTKAPAAKPEKD